jgi:hypothetical protein
MSRTIEAKHTYIGSHHAAQEVRLKGFLRIPFKRKFSRIKCPSVSS